MSKSQQKLENQQIDKNNQNNQTEKIDQKVNQKVRIGFVGLGDHADEMLLPSILLCPKMSLCAISSRNYDKLEDFGYRYNVPKSGRFENWEKLVLSPNIDAIIVSASPELHHQVAKLALQNGKHIFIEKPPTRNTTELIELIELQKTSNLKTFVGYNFTFSKSFGKLGQVLNNSPIKFFRSRFVSSRPQKVNYHFQNILEYGAFSMLIHPLATLIETMGNIQKHDFLLTNFDHKKENTNQTENQITNQITNQNLENKEKTRNQTEKQNLEESEKEKLTEILPKNGVENGVENKKEEENLQENRFAMTNFFQCEKGNAVIEWGNYANRFECSFELTNEMCETGKLDNLNHLEFWNLESHNFGKDFKGKERLVFDNSPLLGGFANAGYSSEMDNFASSILENVETKSEIKKSLEIYRVLDEILAKAEKSRK